MGPPVFEVADVTAANGLCNQLTSAGGPGGSALPVSATLPTSGAVD